MPVAFAWLLNKPHLWCGYNVAGTVPNNTEPSSSKFTELTRTLGQEANQSWTQFTRQISV